jgi:hypothetical protein
LKTVKFEKYKWTGTRDYNWQEVEWFDGSWFGDSPAAIHNFHYFPLNLACSRKWRLRCCRPFRRESFIGSIFGGNGKICHGRFSKVLGAGQRNIQ